MDSKLVQMQFEGRWKLKKATLRPFWVRLRSLAKQMREHKQSFQEMSRRSFECYHVRREYNKRADALANAALDKGMAFARPAGELRRLLES